MKKKFISLLVTALMVVTSIPEMIFADDTPQAPIIGEYDEYADGEQADMDITVHIANDFVVRIPKGIVTYSEEAEYTVGVKGSIRVDKKASVVPEPAIDLELKDGDIVKDTVEAVVTQEKQSWLSTEIQRDTWSDTTGTIAAEEQLTAGDWISTLHFNISLEDSTQAGTPFIVRAIDENDVDLNAKGVLIEGSEKDTLLNELVASGNITDASEVDALVEVTADAFTGDALTSFDVSGLAAEGQSVVLYHYDEETSTWEYIGTGLVDENGIANGYFQSFSPVAIIVTDKLPGMYDDNHLIMTHSWQDMIDQEIITVEDTSSNRIDISSGDNVNLVSDILILPNNTYGIDRYTFQNCTELTRVDCESLMYVYDYAFSGCTNLSSVNLVLNGTIKTQHIGQHAFYETELLNNCIENEIPFIIGDLLVAGYWLDGDVIVPEEVNAISMYAFYENENITSVKISNNATLVGGYAFAQCPNLKSVITSNDFNCYYDDYVFEGCSSLTDILIEMDVVSPGLFMGCRSLDTWPLINEPSYIAEAAFAGCNELSVLIGDNVMCVGSGAFSGCKSIMFFKTGKLYSSGDMTINDDFMMNGVQVEGSVW